MTAGANDRGLRFRGAGTTGANATVPAPNYDWVVQYTSCTPDKSLIKKADVTPSFCSFFNVVPDNPRCLFIDEIECNYSVQIKDTEFPICGGKGVKIEVGDMLPSKHYAERLKRVPPVWDKAFELNASGEPTLRASCVEFVLAGLYAMEKISRAQQHGRVVYEVE